MIEKNGFGMVRSLSEDKKAVIKSHLSYGPLGPEAGVGVAA